MNRPVTNAVRLTFVYKAGKLQLQSRIHVNAMVPPGEPGGDLGFWVELRDASDNPLFRRVLQNPLTVDREVFSPGATNSVARVPGARTEDVFSILVPDDPAAASVVLVSSQHVGSSNLATGAGRSSAVDIKPVDPTTRGIARVIARFQLREND
jgi:hypothetical protein